MSLIMKGSNLSEDTSFLFTTSSTYRSAGKMKYAYSSELLALRNAPIVVIELVKKLSFAFVF